MHRKWLFAYSVFVISLLSGFTSPQESLSQPRLHQGSSAVMEGSADLRVEKYKEISDPIGPAAPTSLNRHGNTGTVHRLAGTKTKIGQPIVTVNPYLSVAAPAVFGRAAATNSNGNCDSVDVNASDDKGRTPLHIAARDNAEAMVVCLLDHDADIEARDNFGRTALQYAAVHGYDHVAALLLDRGADIEALDNDGWTPLHSSAYFGKTAVTQLLLDRGAEVEALDDDGRTPLDLAFRKDNHITARLLMLHPRADVHFRHDSGQSALHSAARYHMVDIAATLLLDRGADIEARNNSGWTPLHRSAYYGKTAVTQLLLDHGAEVEALDDDGRTPLDLAFREGNHNTARLLMLHPRADVHFRHDSGWTPLHYAAKYHMVDIAATLLLDRGADIEARNNSGWTPLHRSAYYGKTAVTQLLLDHGANIETRNNDGRTPLDLAFREGNHNTARLLMLHPRADVHFRHDSGWTPLHYAAKYHMVDIAATLLLDRGADIEARNNSGWTPLHRSAYYGNPAVTQLLLDRGADIETRNNDGRTPLDLAFREGNHNTARLLMLHPRMDVHFRHDSGQSALHYAAKYNMVDIAETLLLDLEADLEARNNDGRTPLHHSAYYGNPVVTQLLLDRGADIETRNNDGRTPLDLAFREGNHNTARLLMLHPHADVHFRHVSGQSALHYAAKYNMVDMMATLLDRGADIEARNHEGHTPLHHSAYYGNPAVTQLLLDRGAEVEVHNNEGRTPLDLAFREGNHNTARLLMLHPHADVHFRHVSGQSALHYAAKYNMVDMMATLLDRGADIEARNHEGHTPLDMVAGLPTIVAQLRDRASGHAGDQTVLEQAPRAPSSAGPAADAAAPEPLEDQAVSATHCVEFLAGLDVQAQDSDGLAPLHHAAQDGDLAGAACLLQAGAAVDVRQATDAATPLHLAAYFGHDGIVERLLAAGADVHARTYELDRRTPLHLAAEGGHAAAAAWLLAAGADPDAQDRNGDTPLHHAAGRDDWTMVLQLLAADADAVRRNQDNRTPPDAAARGRHYCLASYLVAENPRHWLGWTADTVAHHLTDHWEHVVLHAGGHAAAHLLSAQATAAAAQAGAHAAAATAIGQAATATGGSAAATTAGLTAAKALGLKVVLAGGAVVLGKVALITTLAAIPAGAVWLWGERNEYAETIAQWAARCQQALAGRVVPEEHATPIRAGQALDGGLDRSGEYDLYAVALEAGTTYRINVALDSLRDSELSLFAPGGGVAVAHDDNGGVGYGSRIDHAAVQSGTHLIHVSAVNNRDTGTYRLSVRPLDMDRGDGAAPAPIRVGQALTGSLDRSGEQDDFTVALQVHTRYRIEVATETLGDAQLTLYRNGRPVARDDGAEHGARIDYTAVSTTDAYLIRVEGRGDGDTGAYRLSVQLHPEQPQPALDDHGDGFVNATPITVGTTTDGRIERAGDRDMFRVSLQAGRKYRIGTGTGSLQDTELWLYNPRQGLEARNDDGPGGRGGSRIDWNITATGDHFVAVEGRDDRTGTYTLTVVAVDD